MNSVKKAYQRGAKVRASGHSIAWYQIALEKYSIEERTAFMAGYNGELLPA